MPAIKILQKVGTGGRIELTNLPFHEGQQVEITIQPVEHGADKSTRYSLRHTQPYRFDDPVSPVAVDDWEVLRDSA